MAAARTAKTPCRVITFSFNRLRGLARGDCASYHLRSAEDTAQGSRIGAVASISAARQSPAERRCARGSIGGRRDTNNVSPQPTFPFKPATSMRKRPQRLRVA